jgi:hypothetical protein
VYLEHYPISHLIHRYLCIYCDFFLLLGNFLDVVFKNAAERDGIYIDLFLLDFHLALRQARPSPVLASVSRFQEKEKRGEMITKNDNIK